MKWRRQAHSVRTTVVALMPARRARTTAHQVRATYALIAAAVLLVGGCGEPNAVKAANGELLGLFDLAGHEDGHFEMDPGPPSAGRLVAQVKGRFWVSGDGTIRTAADIDHGVVEASIAELLSREAEADREPGSLLTSDPVSAAAALRGHYRGEDFRITLADLAIGVASPTNSVVSDPSILKFMDSDPRTAECPEAMAEFTRAVRTFVAEVRADFVPDAAGQVWAFPVAELQRDVSKEDENLGSACREYLGGDNEDDYVPKTTLRLHRSDAGAGQVLRVLLDDGSSDGPNERELFRLAISRLGQGGQRPPDGPSASMVENYFLLKINECGGLPWEHTALMDDLYEAPDGVDYMGPSPLTADFLCAAELPAKALEQQE